MEVVLKVPVIVDHVFFLFLIKEWCLCSISLLTIDALVPLSKRILIIHNFLLDFLVSFKILHEIWNFEAVLAYIFGITIVPEVIGDKSIEFELESSFDKELEWLIICVLIELYFKLVSKKSLSTNKLVFLIHFHYSWLNLLQILCLSLAFIQNWNL